MIRRVFLAFLAIGLAACSDATGPGSAVGTYTLQTINGELPAQIGSERYTVPDGTPFLFEITGGVAILNEDWTCSLSLTRRETDNGIVTTDTETDLCTYTFGVFGASTIEMLFDDFGATAWIPPLTSRLEITLGEEGGAIVVGQLCFNKAEVSNPARAPCVT